MIDLHSHTNESDGTCSPEQLISTAVAAGVSDSKVEYKGKPSGGALRFTRVYVKRDGRWVMIVSHATRR